MDLQTHAYSVPLHSPLRSLHPLEFLRWGNTSDQKLEVGELRSPESYYTLTTGSTLATLTDTAVAVTVSVASHIKLKDSLTTSAYSLSTFRQQLKAYIFQQSHPNITL